ncbi:polyhydroxyalkanoic acid system family protein [Dokdonella sp.]|jgi:putative polyhydroxyalkanoate system protein|uniref:polyhydroxyalkanoic acid system family protein n=1 Tax=Dokdonella sp. TaxID=2291710 RepID=UPI002F3F43CE
MAVIDIRRSHTKPLKTAKAVVERIAVSIAHEYGIEHHWDGDKLQFDRSGVKGHIAVSKTVLHVRVELGFLMSAMKPVIEREIERKLEEHLA